MSNQKLEDVIDALEVVYEHMTLGEYYRMIDEMGTECVEAAKRGDVMVGIPMNRHILIRTFISRAIENCPESVAHFVSNHPDYAKLLNEIHKIAEEIYETWEASRNLQQLKIFERI